MTDTPPSIIGNKNTFSISTFNIAHGRAKTFHQLLCSKKKIIQNCVKIANFLKQNHSDIVFLQEIDFNAPWSRRVQQLSIVNSLNNYPYSCIGNNQQKQSFMNFNYGNAILSKFEIVYFQNMVFTNSSIGGKGLLTCTIKINNQELHLINLHLHHSSDGIRKNQLYQLQQYLDKVKIPFIIGGDFNTVETNTEIQNLILKYELNRITLDGYTFKLFRNTKTIDFFLASNSIKWLSCNTIDSQLSDHQFVTNTFMFKN